jgi:protein O-mannosyl-transferase
VPRTTGNSTDWIGNRSNARRQSQKRRQQYGVQGLVQGTTSRPGTAWIRSHPVPTFLIFSAIWVLLLYWRALFNPFASYDDLTNIVSNPRLASWHGILYYLRTNVSFVNDLRGSGESYYRPLYWVSLALDHKLWGANPLAFHLTSMALFWLDGCLFFTLLRKLRMPLAVAACTVLLWEALPINSEAVAWISARAYLLAAFFVLLNALLAQRFLEKRDAFTFTGYALSAMCALLSHEAGIFVLPLTMMVAYLAGAFRTRSGLALYTTAAAASAFYFGLRRHLGTSGSYKQPPHIAPFGIVFFKYLSWLVLPVKMSIERSTNTPPDKLSFVAVIAWAGFLAICAAVIAMRRKWPMIATALAWTSISLVPFCGLVPTYQGMAERFLCFASMGLAFLVAALCYSIPPQVRILCLSIVSVWILWGAVRLNRRLVDWSDPILLYQSSLEGSPHSTKLLYNVGAVSEQRGDLAKAERYYHEVLRLQPAFEKAIAGLANVRLKSNDPKDAAQLYRTALSVSPDDVGAVDNYAASLQELGQLDSAAAEYRRAIALAPTNDDGYCGLGVVLYQEGNALGAVVQFLKAKRIDPSDPTPYYDLGAVYEKFGRLTAAADSYAKALELKPGDPDSEAALLRLKRLGQRS